MIDSQDKVSCIYVKKMFRGENFGKKFIVIW